MKRFASILSVILIATVLMCSMITANVSSATNQTSVSSFDPMFRMWHYGGYPDNVSYSTGGYITLESTHYDQQHQVCFYGKPYSNDWAKMINYSLNDEGIIGIDVHVEDCYGTNTLSATGGTGHQQNAPSINIIVKYRCVDNNNNEYEDNLANIETGVGAVGIGETKHFKIQVDDFSEYKSFEIIFVKVAVMNYANLKNENGEQGCGDFSVTFSPFYAEGTDAPKFGENLGKYFDDSLYSWETTDKVTSDDQGNLTPDGPLHDGVDLKRNEDFYPYLADGVTVAKKNSPYKLQNQITTTVTIKAPVKVCSHSITATKITKNATYFATGTKVVYCALCNKTIKSVVIPKKTLAKPKISATGKSKAVKVSWKKVAGATGYVVEMKNGSKYKAVKTINSGKTLSFTKTKLKKKRSYSFRVKAFVKSGSKKAYSAYSSAKSAKAK